MTEFFIYIGIAAYLTAGTFSSIYVTRNVWRQTLHGTSPDEFVTRWLRLLFWPFSLIGFLVEHQPKKRIGAILLILIDPVRAVSILMYGPEQER